MRTESVCRVSSIKDGGYITAETYSLERGLHNKTGSLGTYLAIPVGPKSKIFKIYF